MPQLRVYPVEKLEAAAEVLNISVDDLMVWSDDSLTIGTQTDFEYYVFERKTEKYDFMRQASNGYYVYKQ